MDGAETQKFGSIALFRDLRTRHLHASQTAFVARGRSRHRRCLVECWMPGRSTFSASLRRKCSLLIAARGMLAITGGMGRSVGGMVPEMRRSVSLRTVSMTFMWQLLTALGQHAQQWSEPMQELRRKNQAGFHCAMRETYRQLCENAESHAECWRIERSAQGLFVTFEAWFPYSVIQIADLLRTQDFSVPQVQFCIQYIERTLARVARTA